MKRITLLICILLMSVTFISEAKNEIKGSRKEAPIRIAFLGIDGDNLRSNFFSNELLAEKMTTQTDSIEVVFNQIFFKTLSKASARKNKVNVIYCCFEEGKVILDFVKYNESGDEIISDLSQVPQNYMSAIFEKRGTDYFLLIDQYYIKKEGYPYDNISHIIGYSIYDKNKKIVSQGRHQFASLDIDAISDYSREYTRVANKLLSKIEK